MVRARDALAQSANYYYVTVRSSGASRCVATSTARSAIASAPLAVNLEPHLQVRLESIGTRHRVYVNGEPLLDVDDDSIASGRAALLAFAPRPSSTT